MFGKKEKRVVNPDKGKPFDKRDRRNTTTKVNGVDHVIYEGQKLHALMVNEDGSTGYSTGFVQKIYDQGFYIFVRGYRTWAVDFSNDVKSQNKIGTTVTYLTIDDEPQFDEDWEEEE